MNSYVKTFLRGSAISMSGAVALGIMNYFVRRIMCNSMSLSDYGVFYSTFALLLMVFGFTDLGMTQSGTVMIASTAEEPQKRDVIFSQLFFIKGGLALICAVGVLIFFRISQPDLDLCFTLSILIYFICQTVNGTLHALWGGLKQYTLQQAAYCLVALLTLIPLFIISKINLRVASYCFLFASAATMIFSLLYSKHRRLGILQFHLDKDVCQKLMMTGGIIAITTTLLSVMYNISTIMLHALRGAESAGLYNVALPIMQIVQAAMVFPAVFLPIAVEMGKKEEYQKLKSFVRSAAILAFIALLPTGIFFHYCSPWLIRILFKPEYTDAAMATTLLCLGLVFFTLGSFLFEIMLSLQKVVIMAVIAGLTTACNLILNYFLIKRFGVNGAAGATCASFFVFAFLTYIVLEYNLKKLKSFKEAA